MNESYLKKIEKRYSKKLDSITHDLKEKIISLKNIGTCTKVRGLAPRHVK